MTNSRKRANKVEFFLNDQEMTRLRSFAQSKELTMSEVLRDYIKSLPEPKPEE